jgi:hypothetical protein
MTHSYRLLRLLAIVVIGWGLLVWVGLSLFGFFAVFGGEGSYSAGRQWLIAGGDLFVVLGALAMACSLVLLAKCERRQGPWLAILVVAIAQAALLADALSLAHFVRSGMAWIDSWWRQLLVDLGVVELFAYYGWIGLSALLAVILVVVVATAKSVGSGRPHPR